jgi:uncharacterized lipoprotein YmbA
MHKDATDGVAARTRRCHWPHRLLRLPQTGPYIARHFVLTPLPAKEPAPATTGSLAIGVGQLKIPPYLFETSMALRKGTNEIDYLQSLLWGERLGRGLQRVLTANLSTLARTDKIRLSAWRTEDVSAEVYVAVEQFDVDTRGARRLVAHPLTGGEKTLKNGECRLVR